VGVWVRLVGKIVFVTLFAMAVCFFAVVTIQIGGFGGIQPAGLADAEFIRARNRVRLVSPDWVSPEGDLFEWMQAEMRARVRVIGVIWFGAIVIMTVKHLGRKTLSSEQ
jgi:hypothetical protein